jgi:hypothetical protein
MDASRHRGSWSRTVLPQTLFSAYPLAKRISIVLRWDKSVRLAYLSTREGNHADVETSVKDHDAPGDVRAL